MKKIQGKDIVGHITIHIKGKNPELFFQTCVDHQIPVWDIRKQSDQHCIGTIYYYHLNKVYELMSNNDEHTISTTNRKGYINKVLHLWKRKELIFATLISLLFIFLLSNIAWKIDIDGVPTELENQISEQLKEHGLYEGAWTLSLMPLNILQQHVAEDIPELLYIGIEKKGTTYLIQAEEKLIAPEEEEKIAQHLVAQKSGIIQKMFIKNGQSQVNVHDHVSKGDLLVSGIIDTSLENEDESEGEQEIVTADGEVYANTWYEVEITSNLYQSYEKLPGEQRTKYYLQISNFTIPIWGFQKVPFENFFEETERTSIRFLTWEISIPVIKKTMYNQDKFGQVRTEAEAKEIGIDHALYDLQTRLGKDADILKYYVLHETVENGKVKLNLYISVMENIAIGSPIT